jgi:DNA helicase-4
VQDGFRLQTFERDVVYRGQDVHALELGRSWFRPVLRVTRRGARTTYRGLNATTASALERALDAYLLRQEIEADLTAVQSWVEDVRATSAEHVDECRWIPRDVRHRLHDGRPTASIDRLAGISRRRLQAAAGPSAIEYLDEASTDILARMASLNQQIYDRETVEQKNFFDRVETTPLTDEQRRAVITYDNRVQVVAAAGSGKTSVMVARAAYAIHRGFTTPDRVLLLAFNKAAAEELQTRVDARLKALNLPASGLRADTFHAFGLRAIGEATGKKPRPAPWLDSGKDVEELVRIVDELRDENPTFRYRWDLFRLIYARAGEDVDAGDADGWDPKTRVAGFRTFRGEVVRSQGERMIADWLYLNGVEYEYERAYEHDVADRDHSQYRPDFFYPDADLWHEHWALDSDGKPPAEFTGYAESMRWKRSVHKKHKTRLVETTWAQIIDGKGWAKLEKALTREGLTLDWNPDRPLPKGQSVEHADLARLVRTFMTHVKSASLTRKTLASRMRDDPRAMSPRTRLFLEIYWPVHDRWDRRLRQGGYVDFEDMLVTAADHIESGLAPRRYDLVLVDEFQDASQARARLTRALVDEADRYLLAVGDDWQSINRFAGADLSVMTGFEGWFGDSESVRLQTTFRCPQGIADVATAFVMKNPHQIPKKVTSASTVRGSRVRLTYVQKPTDIQDAISAYLDRLATPSPGRSASSTTVDALGRYRFDRDSVPRTAPPSLTLTFRTVHGAKGLEADVIVLPNVSKGVYEFPSQIADDPVLDTVMARPDGFPHAEERRLFYVALTRARHEVMMFAVRGHESPFVVELVKDGLVTVEGDAGEPVAEPTVCPTCGTGTLVPRKGPYGDFLGCSTFPRCRHTQKAG